MQIHELLRSNKTKQDIIMSDIKYPQTVIKKSDGVNRSEKFLNKLADNTFLSLWSYPCLYNDRGIKTCKTTGLKKGMAKNYVICWWYLTTTF